MEVWPPSRVLRPRFRQSGLARVGQNHIFPRTFPISIKFIPHLWEEVAFFQLASIIVDEVTGEDAAFLRTGAYDFLSEPRMGCSEKNRMFEE